MMFKDIVESVTLLKDDACNSKSQINILVSQNNFSVSPLHKLTAARTLSKRGGRCFLRRRWRLRSLEAVLCSVALLNLRVKGGG